MDGWMVGMMFWALCRVCTVKCLNSHFHFQFCYIRKNFAHFHLWATSHFVRREFIHAFFSVRIISMRQILFSIFSSVIILFRLIFRICLNLLAVEVNLLENFDGRARDVDVIRWRRWITETENAHFEGMHDDLCRGKPFVCCIKWHYSLLYYLFKRNYLFVLSVQSESEKNSKNVFLVYLHRQHSFAEKNTMSSYNLTLYFSAFPLVLHITLMCGMENSLVR